MKKFINLLIMFILIGSLATVATGCKGETEYITTESGLKYRDIEVGTGKEAKSGDNLSMHYTGTLDDGTKFDSSHDRGQTFSFTLDVGQVIAGWDEGVQGMKEGGKRELVIPSDLAYGPNGIPGVIPGGATLNFDVELVEVL